MAKRFLVPLNLSPLSSDPIEASEGDSYFNYVSNIVRVYYDGSWHDISAASGGATNSFSNVATPDSNTLVADSASDVLTFTNSNGVSITGNETTDTIDISTNATPLNTASTIISRDSDQSFDITAVDFDTTDIIASAVGRINWDDGEGTLNLGLKGGNVNLALGQEMVLLCYNGSGSDMSDGDVVYIQGAQGQRPNITFASASSESASSKTLGIVTEPILAGQEGFVTTFGIVNGVNTLGFTEGAALWLDTIPGKYTETAPTSPDHLVFIGYCLKASDTAGRIFVEPQNGYEIKELHDVLISSIQDGQILSYEASTGLWKNIDNQTDPIVPSGSEYPTTNLQDGQLFHNTTNGRTAIQFGSIWKEFAYIGEVSTLDGGNSSTTVFSETIDGGDSSTTVFVGQYDGGTV